LVERLKYPHLSFKYNPQLTAFFGDFFIILPKKYNQMKQFILSLTTAILLVSCSEKNADTNTHITGNIKGFTAGTVYLQKMNDTVLTSIDSVKMDRDSKFNFDFNLDSPEMMYLVVDRGVTKSTDNVLPIFVQPGTINVDTELKYFYANAKITGSENHKLFEQFQKVNKKYNYELLEISKEKFDAQRFNRPQDLDSIENKFNQKLKRKYLFAINFALNNKEHEIAPYVALTELGDANIKFLDTIHNTMSPKVAASKYGKLLTKFVEKIKKEQ
jgi:hypothetical protein